MPKLATLLLLCCALAGCEGEADSPAIDAGVDSDLADAALDAPIGARADASDTPTWRMPTHVSFETALRVEPQGPPHLQDEVSATQVDYYVFAARAGAYYEITTDTHSFSPDNRIELFDGERAQLADNDRGSRWPGDAIDARIIFRATDSGDHYVRVEDLWTPPEAFASEELLLFYHLRVRELVSGPGTAIAGDDGAVELELDEPSGYGHVLLLGDARFDEDVFAIHGMPERALVGRVLRQEAQAAGNLDSFWSEIRVTDAADHAVSIITQAREQYAFHPPLGDADYEVRVVASPDTDHGEHAFYAIDVVLIPDNPRELADEANATPQGSESLALEGGNVRRGLLLATLPSADDVDYFGFHAAVGGWVNVLCEAESGGSLVRGLQVQLEDAEGRVLASATESFGANLELQVEALESADLFLRLASETGPQEEPLAAWARCGLTAAP